MPGPGGHHGGPGGSGPKCLIRAIPPKAGGHTAPPPKAPVKGKPAAKKPAVKAPAKKSPAKSAVRHNAKRK